MPKFSIGSLAQRWLSGVDSHKQFVPKPKEEFGNLLLSSLLLLLTLPLLAQTAKMATFSVYYVFGFFNCNTPICVILLNLFLYIVPCFWLILKKKKSNVVLEMDNTQAVYIAISVVTFIIIKLWREEQT